MNKPEHGAALASGRPPAPAQGALIAGRYEFRRELGGGGMAVVYEVVDRSNGRRLALKRLHVHARTERQQRARAMFEREYFTLAQLAHPRIARVYDYGLDDHEPYYTMELLDGGDLHKLLPVDPKRLCAIARDVCSALSLLHSRRVLHRDISPRNIRCTSDGQAKLIDFGAMTSMGPCRELVGTPAYSAPELVQLQPLDARTDLYSLGATLYHALTGRQPYPAHDFASLTVAWTFAVTRPSELVSGVPPALDALLLDLLQLDPRNRPSSAAELVERLAAIEGQPVEEQLPVAQAYLSTPVFVGRERALSRVRMRALRTQRSRGGAMLVQGAPGVGRSRFIDACVLTGKLLGLTVLRADSHSAEEGEYGMMRSLLLQLHAALPAATNEAAADHMPVLVHVVPELRGDTTCEPKQFDDVSLLRPQLQQAVRQLFRQVAVAHPLLFALDDLHLIDEPSVATLALLARELKRVAIQVVASGSDAAAPGLSSAYQVFASAASCVTLEPLQFDETRCLLSSVFGEAANLDLVVHRLQSVSHGNPRDLMRCAQHLVDRGIVRYRAGSWSLPAQIDTSDLPNSVAQVLRARASALSPGTRALGGTLALCPLCSFTFEECRALVDYEDPARLLRELGALVIADIVRSVGDRFALTDRAFVPVLLSELGRAETAAAQLRLARVFEQRGGEQFRAAQHLLRAGEGARALDLFVAHAIESQALTERSPEDFYKLIRSLPDDWLATYEEAIALSLELSRPKAQLYALRSRLAGLVAVVGLRATEHVSTLLADLRQSSGLADWDALDPTLPPTERLSKALAAAQARYDAAPDTERTVDPLGAIRALARTTITALGMYAPLLDAHAVQALPSLEPLAALSPALQVVSNLTHGVHARLTGRTDAALALYKDLIERTNAPDRAGLESSHHRFTRIVVMNALGMLEASMGLASSLDWAQQIEADPLFQVNGQLVRALYRLWQGDCLQADHDQRQLDALRIESSSRQNFENTHLLWQVTAHAAMDDLTRLQRTVEEIRRAGEDFPGWKPVLAYASAEFQRVRGDLSRAESELQTTLCELSAGSHQIWVHAASAHVRVLDAAGRGNEAVELGRRYLTQAHAAELGFTTCYILMPLALAEAKQGLPEAAEHAMQVVEQLTRLGATGLNLALANETRARVALAQDDKPTYVQYAGLLEQQCSATSCEVFAARFQKLERDARARHVFSTRLSAAQAVAAAGSARLKTALQACSGQQQRAQLALIALAAQCRATEGFLYYTGANGLACVAGLGPRRVPPPSIDRCVEAYILAESSRDSALTQDVSHAEATLQSDTVSDTNMQPVLLSHYAARAGYVITGLALFAVRPNRSLDTTRQLATQISRLSTEFGDAVPMHVQLD